MALAKSLAIFTPKRSGLSSQDWFLKRDDSKVHTAASVQDFNSWRRHKDCPLPALITWYCPSGLISALENEVKAGWHLVVPGELQGELGWGSPKRRPRKKKVRLNRLGLGLKSPNIMEFLKWLVWKLFRPTHLFLITLRTIQDSTCSCIMPLLI